jgi:hypothetical protein
VKLECGTRCWGRARHRGKLRRKALKLIPLPATMQAVTITNFVVAGPDDLVRSGYEM